MPYKYKKVGDQYVVYKKDTGKRVGATGGTKEELKKYLAALHINAKESKIMETNNKMLRSLLRKEIKSIIAEEMAAKDYDKDGKVEKSEDEWKGARDKAIKSNKKETMKEGILDFFKKKKAQAPKASPSGKPIVGMDFDGYYIDSDGNRV